MKFQVNYNVLCREEMELEISPESFLHCADVVELLDEVEDYIYNRVEFPDRKNAYDQEVLGLQFYDTTFGDFIRKWQELKELQKEQ
jgi:hypothetical protein